ncbi:hypothetical protein IU11_12255 [Cellulosimicrobium sp. MM]|nr:hypothetical protein IU11_12255 [Cellulosimicrobium sp. MM]
MQRATQERREHDETEVDREEPQELRRQRRERADGVGREPDGQQDADGDHPRPDEDGHRPQQAR